MEAYGKIIKAQKEIGQDVSQFDKSAHNNQRSNNQKNSNTRLQTKKHWIQRIVTSVAQIKINENIFKKKPTVSKKKLENTGRLQQTKSFQTKVLSKHSSTFLATGSYAARLQCTTINTTQRKFSICKLYERKS